MEDGWTIHLSKHGDENEEWLECIFWASPKMEMKLKMKNDWNCSRGFIFHSFMSFILFISLSLHTHTQSLSHSTFKYVPLSSFHAF